MQARKDFRAGLAASIALHLLALFCLLRFNPVAIEDMPEPVVSVTMVPESVAPENPKDPPPSPQNQPEQPLSTQPSSTAPSAPPASPSPAPSPGSQRAPQAAPLPQPAPDQGAAMKEANAFYASAILARPENRSARDALKTLSSAERNEQICDTEAMEQIRRADPKLHPDRLIAYALENTQLDGNRLHAPGAAFRSAHRWFHLAFDCTMDPGRQTVTAFRFAIGTLIPSSQWNDLQLER